MMMAAIAITKTKPAEATKKQFVRRLPAPDFQLMMKNKKKKD